MVLSRDTNGEPLLLELTLSLFTSLLEQVTEMLRTLMVFTEYPYMKVGGPYKVTISYTGYEDFVRENVILSLGQSYQLNAVLSESSILLEGVEVVASNSALIDGNRDGQSTTVDERTDQHRSDCYTFYCRLCPFNPLASVSEDTDGFFFTIAGQNKRYQFHLF
jgi:hypothetical protein